MPPSSTQDKPLSPLSKVFWSLVGLLGMASSQLSFDVIRANFHHPWVPSLLSLHLSQTGAVLFNTGLISIWGFLHSLLAQESVQKKLHYFIPKQATRVVYLNLAGLSLLLVETLWQSLPNPVIAKLPLSDSTNFYLNFISFHALYSMAFLHAMSLFGFDFFGLPQLFAKKQERTAGSPTLITTGFYSFTRHPMYLLTFAAFAVSPIIDKNRLLVMAILGAYLYFAIPVEEKKLISIFGKAYVEYRKRVPAVLPKLF